MNAKTFRVDIWKKDAEAHPLINRWIKASHRLGIDRITGFFEARVFFLQGELDAEAVNALAQAVLADPITEQYAIRLTEDAGESVEGAHSVEVVLLPGVTDSAAENLLRLAKQKGITGLSAVATGKRYVLEGELSPAELEMLAVKLFSNPIIQRYQLDGPAQPSFVQDQVSDDLVETVPVREADDDALIAISQERRLALNLAEMQAIRAYFQSEGRDPSDLEIEMLAQTWSEHCVHKTFRAEIHYEGPLPGSDDDTPVQQRVDGILKTYLRSVTEGLNKPWVRSAFVDNAGIIRFDEKFDLAFKVETHNHPSAVEPFGGSNTGVGGVVRDVLGVSARPIANTDVLCFGPTDVDSASLPSGVIHPSVIEAEVIRGVEDYGNKMGIPTVNGAVLYHPDYTANPLVFCGCLGLLPHGSHRTEPQVGDLIVVLGGRTGRDGLRGATFSSMEMDGVTGEVAGSSVQIGHPIQEKQVQEVILQARDAGLYTAITDCGAGGLSSAVGEIAKDIGAVVELESVPLKYSGLRPWEIWLSEAQERMVLAVAPENWEALQAVCAGQDVEAVAIGRFEPSKRLLLQHKGRVVGDLEMDFLHEGLPRHVLSAQWSAPQHEAAPTDADIDLQASLLKLLAHPNIRSKAAVLRLYDHEVQGGTAVKPLVGTEGQGHGDAAVLVPLDTQAQGARRGVVLSNGICPEYGELDPYAMAWAAIDEAFRNLVAVGGDPEEVAILDNFCWGNPQLPDRLGSLVRCSQGCHDAALAYQTPFISGKDSLNNEFRDADGQLHAIPGTLLISAVGIVPDVEQTVTADFKAAGNLLYLFGETRPELGGSHYHLIHGLQGGTVPQPRPDALDQYRALHQVIKNGLVQACHDLSEGGLAVALAEMSIAGELGASVKLNALKDLAPEVALFAESTGRFVLEVRPEDAAALEAALAVIAIGRVEAEPVLRIEHAHGDLHYTLAELRSAWGAAEPAPTIEAYPAYVATENPSRSQALTRQGKPKVLVLHANGTNRDREAALACEKAGGEAEIVHMNQLLQGERHLLDYHMLVLPGGFSYGDDLGAGVLWAEDLRHHFYEDLHQFVQDGRPTLGICNGFQALVKAGLLPEDVDSGARKVTLTYNEREHFECRWVYLQANPHSPSLFTQGLSDLIYCPIAHGEGRFVVEDSAQQTALWNAGLLPLVYVDSAGQAIGYPGNPNGSEWGIAAACNTAGNVMGLMPHPEDHIFQWQHPRWHRGESGLYGLPLFVNGIKNA